MSEVIDALLNSDEPCIRYRARVDVLGEPPDSPEALALREAIRRSDRVARLLSLRGPDGRIPGSAYSKWTGAHWVLIKGGHLSGDPVDVLFDGAEFMELARPRVRTQNTHGTGCTYASAIATFLGHGCGVPDAVAKARDAVQVALEHSLPLGRGHGPLDHRAMFEEIPSRKDEKAERHEANHNDTTSTT